MGENRWIFIFAALGITKAIATYVSVYSIGLLYAQARSSKCHKGKGLSSLFVATDTYYAF